ncbi:PTS sugar transporter subunit IIC [Fructobacillus ficulneus]|nr:PTS sugar transporter subunit IIC [Fructobacillus ficulneus]
MSTFFQKGLTGTAQGILFGLMPMSIMKNLLTYTHATNYYFGSELLAIVILLSSFVPLLIGMAVALQFNFSALETGVVSMATMVAANSVTWGLAKAGANNPVTGQPLAKSARVFLLNGTGDVLTAMVVALLAVLAVFAIRHFFAGFGSLAIILTPILVGGGIGLLGTVIRPSLVQVTTWIGDGVESLTKLAPLPMAIFIAMAFSVILVTPISTVGVALAINIHGLAAGAGAMGVVATTIVLLINSAIVNKKGTTLAILLGAMKGMMPAVLKKPVTMIAFALTAGLSALGVVAFNIQGTPVSTGFGYGGLTAPIASMARDTTVPAGTVTHLITWLPALLGWVVIPLLAGLVVQFVLVRLVHLYKPEDFKQEL